MLRCDRQQVLRRLKRIRSRREPRSSRTATRCIRDSQLDIDDLNHRIAALDSEIVDSARSSTANHLAEIQGVGSIPRRSDHRVKPATFAAPN